MMSLNCITCAKKLKEPSTRWETSFCAFCWLFQVSDSEVWDEVKGNPDPITLEEVAELSWNLRYEDEKRQREEDRKS